MSRHVENRRNRYLGSRFPNGTPRNRKAILLSGPPCIFVRIGRTPKSSPDLAPECHKGCPNSVKIPDISNKVSKTGVAGLAGLAQCMDSSSRVLTFWPESDSFAGMSVFLTEMSVFLPKSVSFDVFV